MKSAVVLVPALAASIIACGSARVTGRPQLEPEVQAVYSVVLLDTAWVDATHNPRFLADSLRPALYYGDTSDHFGKPRNEARRDEWGPELYTAWYRANAGLALIASPAGRALAKATGHAFVEGDRVRSLIEAIGSEGVHDSILVWLSGVGFNTDSSRALVHLRALCGSRCGSGTFFELRRTREGSWVIAARRTEWQS